MLPFTVNKDVYIK